MAANILYSSVLVLILVSLSLRTSAQPWLSQDGEVIKFDPSLTAVPDDEIQKLIQELPNLELQASALTGRDQEYLLDDIDQKYRRLWRLQRPDQKIIETGFGSGRGYNQNTDKE